MTNNAVRLRSLRSGFFHEQPPLTGCLQPCMRPATSALASTAATLSRFSTFCRETDRSNIFRNLLTSPYDDGTFRPASAVEYRENVTDFFQSQKVDETQTVECTYRQIPSRCDRHTTIFQNVLLKQTDNNLYVYKISRMYFLKTTTYR